MLMISVIQILFFVFVTRALQVSTNDGRADTWWYRVTRERSPFQPVESPCLLRGPPLRTRDDYTYTSGIGGYKVHTTAATWHGARRICEEEGGHLAIINSVAEAKVIGDLWNNTGDIFGLTGDGRYAFIGFHDLFQEGEYLTIHGQSLAKAGYTQFAPLNPNNKGRDRVEEDCGSVDKAGRLNDEACHLKDAFICELPSYSPDSGLELV